MRPDEVASFSSSPRLRPSFLLGVMLETSGEPGPQGSPRNGL